MEVIKRNSLISFEMNKPLKHPRKKPKINNKGMGQ